MAITVVRAGMLTTVQDLGRRGHRAAGVPLGGAMDPMAARLTNLLVGNAEDAAVLEFTLLGPELEFAVEATIALGGGDFGVGPLWQPLHVKAGDRVKFGAARAGCRGYLAVAGGFDVPLVLGGRGTYLRAGLGGFEGRALRDGDVLRATEVDRRPVGRWHIDERILPAYGGTPTVRVLPGAQAGEFGVAWLEHAFTVSPKSDRMGVRLTGPMVERDNANDLVSSCVAPGTVQVPPDGQPIVLMADAQTIGGYPQLAHVISVDLPVIAQLRPGDTVRFASVTLDEAHRLMSAREHAMAMLREGLVGKLR
jgi:antagonist of KipI